MKINVVSNFGLNDSKISQFFIAMNLFQPLSFDIFDVNAKANFYYCVILKPMFLWSKIAVQGFQNGYGYEIDSCKFVTVFVESALDCCYIFEALRPGDSDKVGNENFSKIDLKVLKQTKVCNWRSYKIQEGKF
jgi:hypothetical protein